MQWLFLLAIAYLVIGAWIAYAYLQDEEPDATPTEAVLVGLGVTIMWPWLLFESSLRLFYLAQHQHTMRETGKRGVQARSVEIAESYGWLAIKLHTTNRRGWPDCLFVRRGIVIFVEFKAPGAQPTKQQLKRHNELTAKGAIVHVIDHPEQSHDIFA